MGAGSTSLPAQDMLPLGQFVQRSSTNQMGRVLPVLYGTRRLAGTFISEFFDVALSTVYSGGKTNTYEGTNYFASFAMALCLGPVTQLSDIWFNGTPVYTNDTPIYALSLACVSNVATFTTNAPHGLTSGETVDVFQAFQPFFNGQFVITVTGPTTFTYVIPGGAVGNQTATPNNGYRIYALLQLSPIMANGADFTDFTIPLFGNARIYWGTETQPADFYLTSVSGISHPAYHGICYIVFHQLFLGFNQTSVQNIEATLTRCPSYGWQTNKVHSVVGQDCNPASMYADMLLNPRLGLGCNRADVIDISEPVLDACIETLYAEGIGFSPTITRDQELASLLTDSFDLIDAFPTLDANFLLSMVLKRYTNAPVAIDQTMLTALPQFEPSDWSEVITETQLNYIDQDAGFQPDYVSWHDFAAVYAKDRPEPQFVTKQQVTSRTVAQTLCNILGQFSALPKTTGTLKLAFGIALYQSLQPGAALQLTCTAVPRFNGAYRVTEVSIDDPAKPEFTVKVETDRTYLYIP